MESYKKLLLANQAWVREQTSQHPSFFKDLAKDQQPEFLWIGCSDSRVPAEEVTGARPGQLFVHRNVANMIVATDLNLLSVLHYAVEALKVKHIVVCAHYGCGGVRASLGHRHLGLLDRWLEPLKDTYARNDQTFAKLTGEAAVSRLVELNLAEQVNNLSKTHVIQKAWKNSQMPLLHGWVYDMETGLLNDMVKLGPETSIADIYRFDI